MHYVVHLDRLAALFRIGIHDFERDAPQRLFVSVRLVVTMSDTSSDDIAEVYNYDNLRAAIIRIAQAQHYELQETVIARIADYCRSLQGVSGGVISTAKPDVFADAAGVGCTYVWGDPDARQMLAIAP
jgi:7,8-dihydroneopterin aldolase/epimerase/oxygenase